MSLLNLKQRITDNFDMVKSCYTGKEILQLPPEHEVQLGIILHPQSSPRRVLSFADICMKWYS